MTRTVTVKKVTGGWRVYVYGAGDRDPGAKSISRTFRTKAKALASAKNQRERAFRKWLREADRRR